MALGILQSNPACQELIRSVVSVRSGTVNLLLEWSTFHRCAAAEQRRFERCRRSAGRVFDAELSKASPR